MPCIELMLRTNIYILNNTDECIVINRKGMSRLTLSYCTYVTKFLSVLQCLESYAVKCCKYCHSAVELELQLVESSPGKNLEKTFICT